MEKSHKNAEFKGKKPEFCGEIQLNSNKNSHKKAKFSAEIPKIQANSNKNSQKFNGFFEIHDKALNVPSIYSSWFEGLRGENLGAFITFCGIVRAENEVESLHFDICDELLKGWFEKWCEKVAQDKAWLCFAHARGEVKIHQSSYLAGVASKQRRLSLRLIGDFVEDFKANAPIWKFDVKDGEKIYALDRSHKLKNAGILG